MRSVSAQLRSSTVAHSGALNGAMWVALAIASLVALGSVPATSATELTQMPAKSLPPKKKNAARKPAADAAPAAPETARVVLAPDTPRELVDLHRRVTRKLRVGFTLAAAPSLQGANVDIDNTTVATTELSSGTTPAIEIRWSSFVYEGDYAPYRFNWFTSLNIEREREVGAATFRILNGPNAGQTTTALTGEAKPTYQSNVLAAGLEWRAPKSFYFPVGINLPVLTRSNVRGGTFDLGPRVGFQVGAGLEVNPNFEMELMFRRVNYALLLKDPSQANLKIGGSVDATGLALSGRYIF